MREPRARVSLVAVAAALACGPNRPASAPPTAAESSPDPPAQTAPEPAATEPEVRTIVLVRHGEKVSDERDAGLSDAGRDRARCLAEVLEPVEVDQVFHTEFARTQDTAEPTARQAGVRPQVLPAASRAELVQALRALPLGSQALVVGHSNTIPDIVRELGAGEVALADDEFDRMFVVHLPAEGPAKLESRRYCPVGP
jgi:phosphohistidine phosphatase SixA